MFLPLLLAIASTSSAPISLSTLDGALLAHECREDRGTELNICATYILGVADALQLNGITCRPPSSAATLQTIAIARRYIVDHPEKWGLAPSFVVQEALIKAFPCGS